MLRLCTKTRRTVLLSSLRTISSSPPPPRKSENSIEHPKDVKNSERIPPPPPPILRQINPLSLSPSSSHKILLAISATLISAILASIALTSTNEDRFKKEAIERSKDSIKRIVNQMKQTGIAATVLLKSLRSVLSSANQEVRSGFEIRVASLLADIVAANESRRSAIVGAGGGAVVDWLLEMVSSSGDNCGTQAESARALAYLIADQNVCEKVLGRPHAVPNLLRFIFTFQPQRSKK